MAEDEANSSLSHDEGGSSGDETAANGPAGSAAGGKRKRTPKYQKTSCELCKARKVKCDRAEPACSWCARHNRACVYLERQKPGSRIGFTLELESKVNRVDALLQTLWRRVEDHIAHGHGQPLQTLSPTVSCHNADAFAPADGARSPGPGQPVALRSAGATPATFPSPAWRGAAGGGGSVPPPRMLAGPWTGVSSLATASDLPPQDVVYALVDLYFKHCNTWCPILDRRSTFGAFFGCTSLSEADRVLVHAIVATTLRFLADPRLSPDMRARYHAVSRHCVMAYAMEHVSVAALKALVILALDELGTSNGPRGWNLLALLAQNARHLGLCDERRAYLAPGGGGGGDDEEPRALAVVGRPASWINDEGRRRLCWMVYLLDRYATVAAAPAAGFLLADVCMRRVLPCSYDLFSRDVAVETRSLEPTTDARGVAAFAVNRPENLGSFSYHCEVLRILSRIHGFLQAPVDVASAAAMAGWRSAYCALDMALDAWLQSLPSEYSRISALCHSDPASRVANWFMLHSAYVTSVVRLHSAAAYPMVRSAIFVPSHYAMQRCLSAVQSLRDVTQDVYEAQGLDLVGPPFAFSLWVAARLLVVHAATAGGPLDAKVGFFIHTLGHVGQYWDVANGYARVLARAVQRERQSETSFAVMRRSAYDLARLTASTRQTGRDETTAQAVTLGELDSMDLFCFFNYPKTPEPAAGQTSIVHNAAVADPDSDWLGYGPPYD